MNNQKISLGGAKLEAINKTIGNASHSLSIADAGTFESFLNRWVSIISTYARNLKQQNKILSGPLTIIQVPNSKETGEALNWKHRPLLGINPLDDLAGTLAVVSEIGGYVNHQKFIQTEILETEIESANLQIYPTIMLSALNHIYVWPEGISGKAECIEMQLHSDINIDENKIDNLLETFYKHRAQQGMYWWKDASKHITIEEPEKVVQHALWTFLLQLAEFARVVIEAPVDSGRADVTIRPRNPNLLTKSCVLELKTIRSFHTPKSLKPPTPIKNSENEAWACSGVQQAAAYRDAESLDFAFLCVYDFRKTNDTDIDTKIRDSAKIYNVTDRRYWISSTHKAYRNEYYPLKQTK